MATKKTELRTVYVLREAEKNGTAVAPQVNIEMTARGGITYGVRVTGRTLAQARERAEAEFTKLRDFARAQAAKPTEAEG